MIARLTKCEDCGYNSLTWDRLECSKCGGKLEIIATENKKELENETR